MSRIVAAIRAAAERGDPEGQYMYANLLFSGTAIPKDYQQSLSWEKKAAEQGYAPAQSSLGTTYYYGYKGEGIEINRSEAFKWYGKGAQGGHDHAQYMYGVMLAEGDSIKKDLRKAVSWWEKAAAQGHDDAISRLEKLRAEGNGALLTPGAITGNLESLQKRAQQGDPEAQKKLGDKLRLGKGVAKDRDAGIEWLRKALPAYNSRAEQGEAEYQYEVGNIVWYINGGPVLECFRWYVKAANQGHLKAISALKEAPWIQ